MTNGNRKLLRWIMSACTFVAVVVAAGCAGTCPHGSAAGHCSASARSAESMAHARPQPPAPASGSDTAHFAADRNGGRAPAVNLFGEFDGVRPANGTSGNAAYQQHTFLEEGYDAAVSVDPTGQWMVFASTRHSVHPNIYLQRVGGRSVTQLTNDAADAAFPVFSPCGTRIAFCSTRNGQWDIYIMDRDGRNLTQVTDGPMHDMHPGFSPDGTRLVYSSIGGRSDQWELWVVHLITGERKMIGHGLFPSWSADRNVDRIAFQRARQRGSRWFGLWTLDLVDGEPRRISEIAASANAAIVSPKWSPDGKRLTFSTVVDPTGGQSPQQDIWVINADGTGRQRLTDGRGTNLTPFWAVDNRVYFISDRAGAETVWSVLVDAGNILTVDTSDQRIQGLGSADVQEIGR